MGSLTTHVLDTARGMPGAGIRIELYELGAERRCVASMVTNEDGRTDRPLLDADKFAAGSYELVFAIGDYFAGSGLASDQPFLDDVVIRVTLAADEHYHVPLLTSPWSYSTYRGS